MHCAPPIAARLVCAGLALLAIAVAAAAAPPAMAQSRLMELIDRLRGDTMPDGIAKSNGRIEATQIDIAAKYAGRISELLVDEGDEVAAGQIVATIASPETEAQLRGAQARSSRPSRASRKPTP